MSPSCMELIPAVKCGLSKDGNTLDGISLYTFGVMTVPDRSLHGADSPKALQNNTGQV